MSPVNATNAWFIMGLIVFVSSRRDMTSQYGEGRNISVSSLRYSVNHKALDSWPIRAHLVSQNDELCKKINVFHKGGAKRSSNNVQYVENYGFFNLRPHKHIALHQIHKIMLFLGKSYDPFN